MNDNCSNNGYKNLSSEKMIAILAVAVLTVSALAVVCIVSSDTDADRNESMGYNLHYEVKDGVMTISGTGEMEETKHGAYPYSWYIKSGGYDPSEVKSIVFEEGITMISVRSFCGFPNLTGEIVFPNSLEKINDYAFKGTKITKITFKEGSKLTKIGMSAFEGCKNLKEFNLPDSLSTIEFSAFKDCTNLEGPFTVPKNLYTIQNDAFNNCSKMKGTLDFSQCKMSPFSPIGNRSFMNCSSLTGEPKFPADAWFLGGWNTFENCTGLTGTIVIGQYVNHISEECFKGCTGLTGVQGPSISTTVGGGLKIYATAFEGCTGLTKVSFPVGTLNDDSFKGCTNLKSVSIGKSASLSSNVFNGVEFYDDSGNLITDTGALDGVYQGTEGKLYWVEPTADDASDDDATGGKMREVMVITIDGENVEVSEYGADSGLNIWMIATPIAFIIGALAAVLVMRAKKP